MTRKFIAEIIPGDSLEQPFLVRSKQLRTQRNGSFFLDLDLMDKTGSVSAKFWDASLSLNESFAEGDYIMVEARSETYRNQLQLVLTFIARMDPADVDPGDYLPSTSKNVGKLLRRLRGIAREVGNPHLQELLKAFLYDEEFVERFKRVPAGVSMHHACLGGLLEHTASMTELALIVADHYPMLDRDLLVAGTILHDVGKTAELDYERGFRYTDRGGLVGHITVGAMMVERRAAAIEGFPGPLRDQMLHLVLSHHGAHEFGAPVLPATAEAVALHYLDNLDAKLFAFEAAMLADMDPQSNWTQWNRVFERRLFKGKTTGSKPLG